MASLVTITGIPHVKFGVMIPNPVENVLIHL